MRRGGEQRSTAAEGISEAQRRQVLGQCIDANALQVLMAATRALWYRTFLVADTSALHCLLATSTEGGACSEAREQTPTANPHYRECEVENTQRHVCKPLSFACALAAAADLQEKAQRGSRQEGDIWSDQPVMQYLKTGQLPAQLDSKQRVRVQRRAQSYYLQGDQLMRRLPDGTHRVVPPPAVRAQLIHQQHELCGHFGVRRTAALVLTKYWWYGLLADTAKVVSRCEHCSRVHASFTAKPEQLQSIPISSMGFRWHVDLTGPLPKSNRQNTYIIGGV